MPLGIHECILDEWVSGANDVHGIGESRPLTFRVKSADLKFAQNETGDKSRESSVHQYRNDERRR